MCFRERHHKERAACAPPPRVICSYYRLPPQRSLCAAACYNSIKYWSKIEIDILLLLPFWSLLRTDHSVCRFVDRSVAFLATNQTLRNCRHQAMRNASFRIPQSRLVNILYTHLGVAFLPQVIHFYSYFSHDCAWIEICAKKGDGTLMWTFIKPKLVYIIWAQKHWSLKRVGSKRLCFCLRRSLQVHCLFIRRLSVLLI